MFFAFVGSNVSILSYSNPVWGRPPPPTRDRGVSAGSFPKTAAGNRAWAQPPFLLPSSLPFPSRPVSSLPFLLFFISSFFYSSLFHSITFYSVVLYSILIPIPLNSIVFCSCGWAILHAVSTFLLKVSIFWKPIGATALGDWKKRKRRKNDRKKRHGVFFLLWLRLAVVFSGFCREGKQKRLLLRG